MKKNYILEVALTEAAIFLLLWLLNPYIGFMLTLFFVGISFCVLIVSLISELIERTRITRAYFWWMGISIIVPLVIAAFFIWADGGSIENWMQL